MLDEGDMLGHVHMVRGDVVAAVATMITWVVEEDARYRARGELVVRCGR